MYETESCLACVVHTACESLYVRNSLSALRRLASCTVIEGQLHIVLTDDLDFANVSFPRLREITDYLVLYRVSRLRSLSTLFPNLSVIRGQFLLYNYALVIREMPDMYDVGLVSLMQISRGSVRLAALLFPRCMVSVRLSVCRVPRPFIY